MAKTQQSSNAGLTAARPARRTVSPPASGIGMHNLCYTDRAGVPPRHCGKGSNGGSAMYTLGEAARATGKSKPTIARAIQSGRLSAARGDDGAYAIDPAELSRIYPVTGNGVGHAQRSEPGPNDGQASEHLLRLVTEQADTIRDLRARLDAERARFDTESEERRKVQVQLTALLSPPPRRSWRWPWGR